MQHFILAIIEAEGVPSRVFTAVTVMEILVTRTVEITETFQFILNSMAMHEVHDDVDTATMGIIDEGLQFIGRTETRGSGKEIGYMVSERAVIGVLLDGHDLDAVIAQFVNTRQHISTELFVGIHFLLLGGHTDMAFVDIETAFLFDFLSAMFPLVFGFGPHLSREDLRLLILHDAADVRRDTLSVTAVPFDEQFVHLAVRHGVLRQDRFPHTVADGLETIGFVLGPVIHIALDIDGGGIRCPFAEHPSFIGMMKTEIEVTGSPLGKGFASGQFRLFIAGIVSAGLKGAFVGLQIRIVLDDS